MHERRDSSRRPPQSVALFSRLASRFTPDASRDTTPRRFRNEPSSIMRAMQTGIAVPQCGISVPRYPDQHGNPRRSRRDIAHTESIASHLVRSPDSTSDFPSSQFRQRPSIYSSMTLRGRRSAIITMRSRADRGVTGGTQRI